tara:strand:+ start:2221 stop:2436 length:216 start_codon:yes stop_codon:yes gene_type:complete
MQDEEGNYVIGLNKIAGTAAWVGFLLLFFQQAMDDPWVSNWVCFFLLVGGLLVCGADRIRTDDPLLAKQVL